MGTKLTGRGIDLAGRKFTRLTAIQILYKKNRRNYWECRCDCGAIKIVETSKLLNGNTKSCTCLQKELIGERRRLPKGLAAFNNLYRCYKQGAKKRNLKFELTKEQFKKLTQQLCYYCGTEPLQEHNAGLAVNGTYIYNGIDRVNNDVGYVLDNCVSCCGICNKAKDILTHDDFVNHITNIYENIVINKKGGIPCLV